MTYAERIDALRALKPDHVLLRMLSLKETQANSLILDQELRKLEQDESMVTEEPVTPDAPEDLLLIGMRMQLSGLYADRAKMSNTFHYYDTDAERRTVSEKVQVLQSRIEALRIQIRNYKDTGRLPEADGKYHVPESPFALLALRDSLRASISRKQREIMHLGREILESKPGSADRLPKCEAKLKDLKNHLQIVQEAIKTRNLQPGRLQEG